MKKLLLFLLFITFISNAQTAKQKIVGQWTALDADGNQSSMTFTTDNYSSMTINGEIIDGKNYTVRGGVNDGQKGILIYELDDATFPIKIDIIAYQIVNDVRIEKGRLLGIIEFVSKEEMRINISYSGVRSSGFTEGNEVNTATLRRFQ